MLLLSRVVLRICLRKEIWFTVSKALEKSKAMATVAAVRAFFIEAPYDLVREWEQGCGSGSTSSETML